MNCSALTSAEGAAVGMSLFHLMLTLMGVKQANPLPIDGENRPIN